MPRKRTKGLGRRKPGDMNHVRKYGFRAVQPRTVATVERNLPLPAWHPDYDQNGWSACVGFGTSMMMSILNEMQARKAAILPYSHRYNMRWLWDRAKERDEWDSTNPGDNEGTSVRASCDVLRDLGHVRKVNGVYREPNPVEGIQGVNRWATTVDEMRTAIADGLPISIGVSWFSSYFDPKNLGGTNNYWIGKGARGSLEGGHCVAVVGASDKKQGFQFKNSWGRYWGFNGRCWIPYEEMQFLLDDWGEACVVVDR